MTPTCGTCIHFRHRARPDLKCTCQRVRKQAHFRACRRFYRPLVCFECAHYVLHTCRLRASPRPFDNACSHFLDRQALIVKGQYPSLSEKEAEQFLAEGFREILSKVFAIEKAAVQALEEIQSDLQKQGVVVPFNAMTYERVVSLMTRLYLINQACQLCGLGHLRDEIIHYELYGKGGLNEPQQATVPARGGNLPVDRGRRG